MLKVKSTHARNKNCNLIFVTINIYGKLFLLKENACHRLYKYLKFFIVYFRQIYCLIELKRMHKHNTI